MDKNAFSGDSLLVPVPSPKHLGMVIRELRESRGLMTPEALAEASRESGGAGVTGVTVRRIEEAAVVGESGGKPVGWYKSTVLSVMAGLQHVRPLTLVEFTELFSAAGIAESPRVGIQRKIETESRWWTEAAGADRRPAPVKGGDDIADLFDRLRAFVPLPQLRAALHAIAASHGVSLQVEPFDAPATTQSKKLTDSLPKGVVGKAIGEHVTEILAIPEPERPVHPAAREPRRRRKRG